MTQPDEDVDRRAAQERIDAEHREYHTWVAVADIEASPGVFAYRRGHVVPISNVERHGYADDGLVVLQDSPEGRAIMGIPEPEQPRPRKAAKAVGGGEG